MGGAGFSFEEIGWKWKCLWSDEEADTGDCEEVFAVLPISASGALWRARIREVVFAISMSK